MNVNVPVIPEIGSVWANRYDEEVEAKVVWADELTIVYTISRRSDNYRNTTDTSSFLTNYKPAPEERQA